MQISESGMKFGNYKPEHIFIIENSRLHKSVGTGVKSVEFVLLRESDKIFYVEAKSSSPKSETSWERYQEFLDEITEKFVHSFDMLCAWRCGRLDDGGEISDDLRKKLRYHDSIWRSTVIVMNDEIAKKYHLII